MKILENREVPLMKTAPVQIMIVLAIAVLLWATGAPLFLDHVKAANLSSVSDTLTNSNNGSYSGHTIQYTNSTSTIAGQTITVSLDPDTSAFTEQGDAATSTHFGMSYNGTNVAIVASCTTNPQALVASTGTHGLLTFTLCAGTTIPGGDTVTIAMATTTGDFINPAATASYRVLIGGTQLNSGETRVAILPNVTLTAAIATTFTFTVNGLATSTVIDNATTTASSTATALPFGTLVAGITSTLGQRLNVTTNARNGFVVTVQENQPPTSGAGAIINAFLDGATTTEASPEPFTQPAGIINQFNTYSHIGLTTNDADIDSGKFVPATSTEYVGDFLTTAEPVFSNNGPADGVTQNIGQAEVAYSIAISPLQAAGNDYTNILTYVATPTF